MSHTGRSSITFFAGLGIGIGLALLFAPLSGEETRKWLARKTEDEIDYLKRRSRRSLNLLYDAVSKGEQKMSRVLKTSKNAIDTLSTKLQ